jgi:hypothetical protein
MPVHHGYRFFAGLISPGASAARTDGINLKLFFALQTLNENGVEVENQPSRPA